MTHTDAVRIWLQALPEADTAEPSMTEQRRMRRQAAASAVRQRLQSLWPDLDYSALRRGANGKPYLPEPYGHWGFNPSDSGGWLLLGLVEGAAIGVDLELRQPRASAMAIARRHFPTMEVDWLRSQDDIDHAFLRLWTLKEALFKAIGRGLSYGLGKACFQPGDDGQLRLHVLEGSAAPASAWTCRELDLGPAHVGAAVWSGPDRPIQTLSR